MKKNKPLPETRSSILKAEVFRSGSSQSKYRYEGSPITIKRHGATLILSFTISAAGGHTDIQIDIPTNQLLTLDSYVNECVQYHLENN